MSQVDKLRPRKLVLFSAIITLLSCCFLVLPTHSFQPPVDLGTFRLGMIGQPRRVDPARAYDTASGELIFNVYEPLIAFSDKRVLPSSTANVSAWGYSDLSMFEPVLAESMPTISPDRQNWTFTIGSGIKWHPWKDANGTLVTDEYLKVADVEYTFKRMLVQDMIGGPSWILNVHLTGYMYFDYFDQIRATNTIEPAGVDGQGERLVRDLINAAITVDGNNITFHFYQPRPENMLMQIFAQSWSCIVNKDFCIEHGCWNGTFYDGWSTDYRQMPSNTYSPLDRYHVKSKYPSDSPDLPAMCGTGPYRFTYWNKSVLEWRIDYWDQYRGGWVEPGTGPHSIRAVIAKGITSWQTRKMMFLTGELDSVTVPTANTRELLRDQDLQRPLDGITLYFAAPTLSNEAMTFTYDVDSNSPYQTKIQGIPVSTFFTNSHVRRAFDHALNFTQYLADAWMGDALHPASWWVKGLAPDYENKTLVPHDIDTAYIQSELQQATFSGINGTVWDYGFETYLCYNLGNDQRRIACEMVAATFASLNIKYKCNVVGLDWPMFLDYEEEYYMPVYFVGWLADFADPDSFVRPYMELRGDPYVDELIDKGLDLPEGEERNQTYQELQYIYWNESIRLGWPWGVPYPPGNIPSLPLVQPLTRLWFRDWISGWYYNQLYPGHYFYDLFKEAPEALPVDVSVAD